MALLVGAYHLKRRGVEKAFDRLDWCFMEESLRQIGLGDNLFHNIEALYNSPSVKVRANGYLSESFTISNGTRQGFPLSPLLYVLVMEHLGVAIRNYPDIHGLTVQDNLYW